MNKPPMEGIYTPNITPIDAKGRVDEDTLCAYVDWLIERGVHGLYPNGSTGEFTRFTAQERRRIIEVLMKHVNGRVPILAGAAEANVRETIDACEAYGAMGVRAVAIVAPFYYKLGPEAVYQYFKEIGDHVTVDVTLYNIPLFASPIDVPTVRRLAAECPRIVGIKDSSGDIPHMMRMIAAVRPQRPEFSFLTVGMRRSFDVVDRLQWWYECHQRCCARVDARDLRSHPAWTVGSSHAIAVSLVATVRCHDSTA